MHIKNWIHVNSIIQFRNERKNKRKHTKSIGLKIELVENSPLVTAKTSFENTFKYYTYIIKFK
jgi:hypothetical protein